MEEVEKFLKGNIREVKNHFCSKKLIYQVFKAVTGSHIKAKDFKKYCDQYFTVKENFQALDNNGKKKYVNMAYEVEYKFESKWRSEYMVEEKRLKRKQVEGFFCNVHFFKNINECILIDENGEVMHLNYYYSNDSKRKINDCFLKKVSITYYENNGYKNISEMKKIRFDDLSLNERKIFRKMRDFYTRKYSILGRVLFGMIEKIEDLTSEEKEILSVG